MHLTKRQREIYEFLKEHIRAQGYAPSIAEIGKRFQLNSPATVHKHIAHLCDKGLIRKHDNLSRAIEIMEIEDEAPSRLPSYPLLGSIAAGKPIETFETRDMAALFPDPMDRNIYLLQVKGDSMIDDHIQDGDYVIVEKKESAENGETVVALLDNERATLKRFYREKGRIRLQPANETMEPIFVDEGEFKIQGVVVGVMRKFK
ncbi:MAG: transcriptional repressor LexA [Candidatus Nitrohelix vancouverensis]|uniref:LexA repressor n=1 Tax=Candidatus Nitrohelix vancouverensis TaxID=2705534 RepID=A0A7T0G2A3_9BACT|nr:MAG: transcriptional repressor LexA [Candidatus Nitrohelix vancouverensis]